MRVLIAHNHYQQFGGEDVVFANERAMLAGAGHEVHVHTVHNDDIAGLPARLAAFWRTPWNGVAARAFGAALDSARPDVVHIHNYFPLLTPSIFFAAHERGLPIVHTLHNFRSVCLNSFLLREGRVCEVCVGRLPWRGVVHRCYRGSLPGSLAVARMIARQRRMGWRDTVQRFVALTGFERGKFVEAGFPAERVAVKPNSIPDPNVHLTVEARARRGALFVGRLSPEKGLRILIEAWRGIDCPLRVAGAGPLDAELRARAPANVTFLGRVDRERICAEMARAAFLVMPSTWYEGFPVTVVESFACGLPIVASRIGSLAELIEDGRTGRHFRAGDAADLAATVRDLLAAPELLASMSGEARRRYEARYTAQANLARLLDIYGEARQAMARSGRTGSQREAVAPQVAEARR